LSRADPPYAYGDIVLVSGLLDPQGRPVALVRISGCHWSYSTSVLIPSTIMPRLDVEVPG
jgi:hypothetical protein